MLFLSLPVFVFEAVVIESARPLFVIDVKMSSLVSCCCCCCCCAGDGMLRTEVLVEAMRSVADEDEDEATAADEALSMF